MLISRGKVARGVAWVGGARVIINLVSFASVLLLARFLTPEDFGLVAIVMAAAAMVTSMTELSLAQALIRLENPDDADFHSAWTLNLIRAALIACLLTAAAFPMARAYGDDRLVALFAVMAGGTFIGALENPRLVLFQRDLVFSRDFALVVTDRVVASVVAVAIAWVYHSYWALVIGTVVANCARVAMSYALLPFAPRPSLASARALLSFSLWLTAANVVKAFNQRSVTLVIGSVLPTAAVGVYSLAERVSSTPVLGSVGALQKALYPAYARLIDDLDRLHAAYLRAQTMTSMIALPVGIGIAAVAEPLVLVLLEPKWLPAVPVMQIIAFATAMASIQNALPLAMALGRPNELFRRNVRSLLVMFPLLFAGYWLGMNSELGGLVGMVLGRGMAWLFNIALNLGLISKVAGISVARQLGAVWRTVASALVMFGVVQWIGVAMPFGGFSLASVPGLALQVISGGLVYGATLLLLCGIFRSSALAEREIFAMVTARIVSWAKGVIRK